MITFPIRQEQSASYRTLIKSSLVTALRSVFTNLYKDPQFKNLRIEPYFSLTRTTWPALYINYQGSVRNAGVGHVEYFRDPNNLMRKWNHRIFDGVITFDIVTESALDRDILSDALVEVLSFGRLDPELNNFFTGIYGNLTDPFSVIAVMQQVALNTDEIISTGDTQGPVPWGAKDLLLYQASFSVDTVGGFYNSIPTDAPLGVIESVTQTSYLITDNQTDIPSDSTPDDAWLFPFIYYDQDYVQGDAEILARESTTSDMAVVIGRARISSVDTYAHASVNTIISVGIPSTVDTAQFVDTATITSVASESAAFQSNTVDIATLSSVAIPSAADIKGGVDSSFVASLSDETPSQDSADYAELTAIVISVAFGSDSEGVTYIDAGTV